MEIMKTQFKSGSNQENPLKESVQLNDTLENSVKPGKTQ